MTSQSDRFLCVLILLAVACRLADCDCRSGAEKDVQECASDDALKLLCVCSETRSDSNRTPICKQSIQSFLACHRRKTEQSVLGRQRPFYFDEAIRLDVLIGNLCKCLNQSQKPSDGRDALGSSSTTPAPDRKQYRVKLARLLLDSVNDPALRTNLSKFELDPENRRKKMAESFKRMDELLAQQKANLERRQREWETESPRLNSSARFSTFQSEYWILFGFLASLLMVVLIWCILYCCQRRSRSSTASDLFISSTPINTYSPINSTMPSNISPISMHDQDHARAALLDGSMCSVDVPSYDDIKPPSYDDAVKNAV